MVKTGKDSKNNMPVGEKMFQVSEWLSDKKAKELVGFDLSEQHGIFDGVLIASAASLRHGQGLADIVLEKSKESGLEFLRMEGYNVGQWILLDMNDLIVHIFQEDARELFRLEDLWPKAAVVIDKREEN